MINLAHRSRLKLGKIDAKNYISERFLKKLEEEGFVKKLMGGRLIYYCRRNKLPIVGEIRRHPGPAFASNCSLISDVTNRAASDLRAVVGPSAWFR